MILWATSSLPKKSSTRTPITASKRTTQSCRTKPLNTFTESEIWKSRSFHMRERLFIWNLIKGNFKMKQQSANRARLFLRETHKTNQTNNFSLLMKKEVALARRVIQIWSTKQILIYYLQTVPSNQQSGHPRSSKTIEWSRALDGMRQIKNKKQLITR